MSEDEAERRSGTRRRRHGRFRRWVVRPVFWLLATLALVALGCALLIESAFVEERGRRWVERRLTTLLEREVTVEELGFDALPPALELRQVRIAGISPEEEPFLEVERLLVEARSFRWRRRELSIGRILIEGPLVRLTFYEDGSRSIPLQGRQRSERRATGAFQLAVGEFTIRDGALEVDHQRLPLSVAGRDLRANLLGGPGLEATGRIDVDDVELLLPRGRPYLGGVSLRVNAGADGLRIVSGRIEGPRLDAKIEGDWIWRPERALELDIDARGDGELFELLGYGSGQVAGPFRFVGGMEWRPTLWGYRGKLDSDRLDVLGRVLTDVDAVVAGDRNGVHAEVARAGYGGGHLTGRIAYRHGAEERPFDLDLQLAGVALSRLLVDQALPLSGLEARVSGPFFYTFPIQEPQRGSGRADLTLRRGAASPGRLQLNGAASLRFEDGLVRAEGIQVASVAQRFLVSGSYDLGRRRGRFDLQALTERVEQLLPLVPIPPESWVGATWAPTVGAGEVAATLTMSPAGVRSDVRLDLTGVEAPGLSAERVFGTFSVDAAGLSALRLELARSNGAVVVNGSLPFAASGPAPELEFGVAVNAAAWPWEDCRAWLPFELPLDGLVSGSLALWGDPEALLGRLDARLADARVVGVPTNALEVELEFEPGEVRFARLDFEAEAGTAQLEGRLDTTSGALDLEVAAEGLNLAGAPFGELAPGVEGSLSLGGQIGGDLERPSLSAELVWSEISIHGLPVSGASRTRVDWDGERVELAGSLPIAETIRGGGRLDVEGFDVALSVEIEDLSELLTVALGRPPGELRGALAGEVNASGSFVEDVEPTIGVRLDRLDLARDSVVLEAVEPVVMTLAGGWLEVESLFLTTQDQANELFVAGRMELGGDRRLDLTTQSSLESGWFGLLFPDVEFRGGRFDALASVEGTFEQPRLNGVGRLAGARALVEAMSLSLEPLEGLLLFYPDRIVVDSVRARTGGGTIEAGGSIIPGVAGAPPSYSFNLVGKGLNLSYPEGWSLRGDARVSIASTSGGRALRGEVELERAYYLEPIKLSFQAALQSLFERRRVLVEETSEVMATTELNLRIRGDDALRVRNNVGNFGGGVDFNLMGSLANPVLFGRVTLDPGGTLVYAGNDYEIERGELNFANPHRIDPILDLVATTDVREYDVRLNLSGTPERFNVGVSSDPPLPELEVLALLTGGQEPSGLGVGDDRSDGEAIGVEGFFASEAASVFTERVNRLFGIDRLRVSPLTGSSGALSSARVTLGERISRDLFVTYSYDPSTTEEQILELEWSVSPRLLVVFTQSGDSSYSLDLRWEKAF